MSWCPKLASGWGMWPKLLVPFTAFASERQEVQLVAVRVLAMRPYCFDVFVHAGEALRLKWFCGGGGCHDDFRYADRFCRPRLANHK